MTDYTTVEELLKGLKRPATSFEIVMALSGEKGKNAVYIEIRNDVKSGDLERIEVEVPGFAGDVVLYALTELLKRNEVQD